MDSTTVLLVVVACLVAVNAILALLGSRGNRGRDELSGEVKALREALAGQRDALAAIATNQERADAIISRLDPLVREEFARSREESQKSLREIGRASCRERV